MKMPFGKFRGVELGDLPDDYLAWLHDIQLRESLRTAVNAEFAFRFSRPDPNTSIPSDVKLMALEIVSAGYRKMALTHHPDHNGDHSTMILVNAAADFLRQALRSTE